MTNTPRTMTQSAFARHMGASKSYVHKLKTEGRIIMTPDGKRVDVEASVVRVQETADPNRDDVAARWARARGKQLKIQRQAAETEPPEDDDEADTSANESFASARARKMAADANVAELELRKLQGSLVEMSAVRKAGADAGALTRSKFERFLDDVVPVIAPNDQARARALMIEHGEAFLNDVANGIANAMEKAGR
jgi:hypothetical protein